MTAATFRRWSYALRTLFVVVTVICLWLGWEFNRLHQRKSIIDWTTSNGGQLYNAPSTAISVDSMIFKFVAPSAEIPRWRQWMGDKPATVIQLPTSATESDVSRVKKAFPEVQTVWVGPPTWPLVP